ncbi:MAG: DUF123 domain-containing protein [Desulfurococcaceae archaeon]
MAKGAGLPRSRGAYVLVVEVLEDVVVEARSRRFRVPRGAYAYVGSAMGPGGLAARLSRHFGARRRPFWHIDYLLASGRARPVGAFVVESEERGLEGAIALAMASGLECVEGFGSSDARGHGSHLCLCGVDAAECRDRIARVLGGLGLGASWIPADRKGI